MQKYIIKQKIGGGSFGEVFLAFDPKRNENLALKRIRIHYDKEEQVKDLVQVKILSKLRHPNVIDLKEVLYDKQSQKGSLIFQYCYTDILHKFIQSKEGRRPEVQIKKCIYEIASALSFVHSKNYIHRDLKPENILLQTNQYEGKVFDVAKLCDFGISKKADELPLTQYIGTRWYRAPELLIKMKNYTKAADIFSLGCIMAEMYNQKILFEGKNGNQQLTLIIKKLGTPTKQTWSQFSNWCQLKGIIFGKYQRQQDPIILKAKADDLAEDLIQKMLVMNPKYRISASEILKHPYFNQIRPEVAARQYAARPVKIDGKQEQIQDQNKNQQLGKPEDGEKQYVINEILINEPPKYQDKLLQKTEQFPISKDNKTSQSQLFKSNPNIMHPKQVYSPNKLPPKIIKKIPALYSPYTLESKHPLSNKKFDYFDTYLSGKQNDDRIKTTYELQRQTESKNSSFKEQRPFG